MRLADLANQYINDRKPWIIAKDDSRADELQAVCTQSLNLFRMLITWLAPVVPKLAERSGEFFAPSDHHRKRPGPTHRATA